MEGLDTYRAQILSSIKTYESSVSIWKSRKQSYLESLQLWADFEQLRKNPIDVMRLEFVDAETIKQTQKLDSCKNSLKQFEELEKKMKDLAAALPCTTAQDSVLSKDDTIMEIREDLDDDGNIIKTSVTPQDPGTMDDFSSMLANHSSHSGGDLPSEGTTKLLNDASITQTTDEVLTADRDTVPETQSDTVSEISKNSMKKKKKKKKKKRLEEVSSERFVVATDDLCNDTEFEPVKEKLVEHEPHYGTQGTFNIRQAADGSLELADDPNGYSLGLLPPGLAEMTEIVNEMDWENDDESGDEDENEDESEDEFGRTKHIGKIPLPDLLLRPYSSQESRGHMTEHGRRHSADEPKKTDISAQGKKKLVFAETLVQGPTAGTNKTPPRSVLKKQTSYPIDLEKDNQECPLAPIIEPPKQSRFKMERSSTDTRIDARHAQPSQSYRDRLEEVAIAANIVERSDTISQDLGAIRSDVPDHTSHSTYDKVSLEPHQDQLFPRKINLAGVDLHPEDGTVKAALSIPKMSEEQLAAIRKKRELLGKKHKRRKSADPSYPVRSSSWDESQPLPKPQRRLSSGEDEQLGETMKAAKVARAKELLKAQDDIAWANSPISPDDHFPKDIVHKNPLAVAGSAMEEVETKSPGEHEKPDDSARAGPSTKSNSPPVSGSATPPMQINHQSLYAAEKILSPKPRKPPTPERRSSYTNIPSPLRQEIQPYSESKEVQFTSDVIKKLEPLMEHETEPTVVVKERKARKMPPGQPRRKTSVDPQNISPTPGSPPPEGRRPGPLQTEEDGSVSHYMVRATAKSPPPHIAIHDLLGDTPEHVRQAVKDDATSPTPEDQSKSTNGHTSETNPMHETRKDELKETGKPANGQESTGASSQTINGIVEHTHDVQSDLNAGVEVDDDEIDDDLHRKEIAHEYHRLRQRMIAGNGGYIKEQDGAVVPLDDDDPGPGKRISRFKAARLGQRPTEQ